MGEAIASLIKIGDSNQLFQSKLLNRFWCILRKDNILKAAFNDQQKIKSSLELGKKFLHNKFIENQKIKGNINFLEIKIWYFKQTVLCGLRY